MSTADVQFETETERIEHWRYEALVRAGYEPTAARRLAARQDVDLHIAVGMLEKGCSEDLALAILL
ncbi:MAG: hypothetical protein ICV59_00170 [Thermoleophilia bacterium]|nr:hypothetical protein [Thermoleophilia bacterium]